jgi:hypothetical protein
MKTPKASRTNKILHHLRAGAKIILLFAGCFGMALPTRAAVTDGLIFYAPFEGSSANDVTGLKTGNLGGTPEFVSAGLIGSFVRLTNNTILPETHVSWEDPTPETNDFSIQVWIRATDLVNGQGSGDPAILANKNWGSGGNRGWVVALGSSSGALGRLQWNFRAQENPETVPPRVDFDPSADNATIQDGTWRHLVITHDRSGLATFYVNGVNVGTANIAAGDGFSIVPSVRVFALGTDHTLNYENGNGSTANGDFDEVAMWNRVLLGGEVTRIHNAGRTGLSILNVPEPTTPVVSDVMPIDGARDYTPEGTFRAVIVDASTALNPASVKLYFDDGLVPHSLQGAGGTNTVTYTPALLAPQTAHEYRLEFSDNGAPVVTRTNRYRFTVGSYLNLLLPTPIVLETFNDTAEAVLPPGWIATNATTSLTQGPNLNNPESDSYLDWVIISSNRFATVFDQRRLNVTSIVTNGHTVRSLINGNFAYAESDNRGGSQVQVLFSPDYDLTGRTNVYLAFHSIYEQNQDSAASVEYSIDEGATWLPALYMMDRDDIIRDASGAIDALATLNTPQGDGAYGQSYGNWFGAPITPGLAPYISGRINDDPVESKRIEFLRLTQADNQAKVRLRFAQSGTGSWYFGIDDVGLYSITQVAPPIASVVPTNVVEAVGNDVVFTPSVSGIGPFTYQWRFNGVDLPNQTNEALVVMNLRMTNAGSYSVRVGYLGGNTNSRSATLMVIEASQALVTGQWDFEDFNLAATCGQPLEYSSTAIEFDTGFATSDFFGLPDLDGAPVKMMAFPGLPPSGGSMSGYIMHHGIRANGGGTKVNKYTLIMDVAYPTNSHNAERAILQTNPGNGDNRDIAIGANNGIGVSGGFQGTFLPDVWQRIAFAVDLSAPSGAPIMAKFINGVKVGQQVLTEGPDARWSLSPATDPSTPWALLFADDNSDVQPGFVSSIQVRNDRLADELIRRMGGPSRFKIPGCIMVTRQGSSVVIRWTGGVPLQSANNLTGPWSDVMGATSPHMVNNPTGTRFYRPKL